MQRHPRFPHAWWLVIGAPLGLALWLLAGYAAFAKDVTVTFTQEEAAATLQLYDMAVKSGGLAVAEAGVILTKKIQDAIKVANEPPAATPPTPTPKPELPK